MSNTQNPDPQDPITVTREDLRLLLRLARPTLNAEVLWRETFVLYPDTGWRRSIRRTAEALGEWPIASGWISLAEARERWGE